MKRIILICLFLFFTFTPCQSQENSKTKAIWTPELSIDRKDICLVKVSPDGKQTLIGYKDKDKDFKGSIRFFVISNKDKKILFTSPNGENYLEVQWSPNGKWISHLKVEENSSSLEIADTKKFTPIPIYTIPSGCSVENFQWSPDGKNITFISSQSHEDNIPPSYKFAGAEVIFEAKARMKPSRLMILSLDLENKKFSGPSFLTPSTFVITADRENRLDIAPYSWAPDSASIVFSYLSTKGKNIALDQNQEVKLALIDINTGKIKELNQESPMLNPVFSPDGKQLAFVAGLKPAPTSPFKKANSMITALRVGILDLEKGTQHWLANTPNEGPQIIGWEKDSSSIIIADNEHTRTALYSLPSKGEAFTRLPLGHISSFRLPHLNREGTHIAFVGEGNSLPPEAYIASLKEFAPVKLTDFHQDLQDLPKFNSEVVNWTSFDGKTIEGILTYPAGYKKGEPVPLVVLLHGGPPFAWQEGFLGFEFGTPPSIALYATHGYAVLKANIRGSDGYGTTFREALYKDWGPGPFKDIMAGVDYLIDQKIADPEKLVIGGQSYGGYITAFTITQTDRFKAALVTAGVTDLISRGVDPLMFSYFGGGFWEDYPSWLENSPMMFVENIKTPTFIQHGRLDHNVNINQGTEFYNALDARKIPVKMVAYMNQAHGFFDEAAIVSTNNTFEWLERYVQSVRKDK